MNAAPTVPARSGSVPEYQEDGPCFVTCREDTPQRVAGHDYEKRAGELMRFMECQDAGLTAILYLGTEGDPEPDQATILHTGPGGGRVLTVQDGEPPTLTVDRSNRTVAFHLDASWQPDCAFARTVTYPVGGQQVQDVIGWSGRDIEDAWNDGIACSQGQPVDAPATITTDADTPAPSAFAALAAVVALALAMRRRNG